MGPVAEGLLFSDGAELAALDGAFVSEGLRARRAGSVAAPRAGVPVVPLAGRQPSPSNGKRLRWRFCYD